MFHWEPEGCYHHRLCTVKAPFWFSMEHCRGVWKTLRRQRIGGANHCLWTISCPSNALYTQNLQTPLEHCCIVITPLWLSTDYFKYNFQYLGLTDKEQAILEIIISPHAACAWKFLVFLPDLIYWTLKVILLFDLLLASAYNYQRIPLKLELEGGCFNSK